MSHGYCISNDPYNVDRRLDTFFLNEEDSVGQLRLAITLHQPSTTNPDSSEPSGQIFTNLDIHTMQWKVGSAILTEKAVNLFPLPLSSL